MKLRLGLIGSTARVLTAGGLLASAGLLQAADYCCVCKGKPGETISASSKLNATVQCTRDCGSFTNVSAGKCAEPAPAAVPAPPAATPAPAPTPAAAPAAATPAPVPVPTPGFVSVAPTAKVLTDDGRIRVIDFQPTAGTKLPMHSHPTMVVYLLEGGATRFTLEDGRTTEGAGQTGDVLINPPVTHSQEHLTPSHAILFEIAESSKFEAPAPATDLVSLAPDHCKLLKEDDRVRVYEYTAKKGDHVAMHSHPTHVVYLLKAGKTQFMMQDGSTPKPNESKDGAAFISSPVTHAQLHLEDVDAIIVELKR